MAQLSKLTATDRQLIRDAVAMRDYHKAEAMKLSNEALAKKFGVATSTISAVINHYYHYRSRHETRINGGQKT